MSYASDLTDEQWALLEPVFNTPGKRGPKHAPDLRRVVDAMLYISHPGCQWRFLPESFGPWTRVWSQFRRWSRNGTWARALTVLHAAAREAAGRARLARRGRPRSPGTRPPAGEVVGEHDRLGDRLAPDCLRGDHPASHASCPWTPSPCLSRSVNVGRSWRAHRGMSGRSAATTFELVGEELYFSRA
jgi:transposase